MGVVGVVRLVGMTNKNDFSRQWGLRRRPVAGRRAGMEPLRGPSGREPSRELPLAATERGDEREGDEWDQDPDGVHGSH